MTRSQIVVSDTSPIVSLAMIERLDLLRQVYVDITIPPAVRDEIVRRGTGQPGAAEVETLNWIHTRPPTNYRLLTALERILDAGEAEAIALARELQADRLLLDERKGRRTATFLGIPVIGLLDVLREAKSQGVIERISPILEDLAVRAHFHMSPKLYDQVLKSAGE